MLSYLFSKIAFYSKIDSAIEESDFDASQVEGSDYSALLSEGTMPLREKLLSSPSVIPSVSQIRSTLFYPHKN